MEIVARERLPFRIAAHLEPVAVGERKVPLEGGAESGALLLAIGQRTVEDRQIQVRPVRREMTEPRRDVTARGGS